MNESLKTVNRIHQLIIAVSSAILAFGLSPHKTKQYEAALQDVAALRQLSMNEYDRFGDRLVPGGSEDLGGQYAPALKEAGYPKASTKFSVIRQAYFKRPNDDSPLTEFFRFFDGDSQIVYVRLEPATLKMRQPLSERQVMYKVLDLNLCEPEALVLDIPDNRSGTPQNGRLVLLKSQPLAETIPVFLSFARYSGDMNCSFLIPAYINSVPVLISGNPAAEWLRSKNLATGSFLRNARAFIEQIGPKSPADAYRFLEEKVNEPEKELSFLGITVRKDTAVWVGPSATFFLLLFFVSHFQQLRYPDASDENTLRTFPWIGLFQDHLSKILTYGSVAFLPILSNIVLISRSWGDTDWKANLVGATITLGITLASLSAAFAIRQVQRQRLLVKMLAGKTDTSEETEPEGAVDEGGS
jgi:hypothetical protein